ncbi:MAG: VCBS repeat-containing protein [Pseudomonadota bacterium]
MRVLALALLLVGSGAVASDAIVDARYESPTTRYAHGVLGDAVEWGTLVLVAESGAEAMVVLPEERVFEDLTPRLADLDGDGAPEVIAVESHQSFGARLSIYGMDGLIAATDYIGTRNRWLAPIGAADLDGDGVVEVAFVDRPHLAKTIRIFGFEGGALEEEAAFRGFSNHRIGEDFISGGIRICDSQPQMVVAEGDWSGIAVISWDGSGYVKIPSDLAPTPKGFDAALSC